ncbi:hypothetical protein ACFL4Y_00125 [Gemmatimonadota bacterium]
MANRTQILQLVVLVLVIAGCSERGNETAGGAEKPLADVVTLELTFGDSDLADDFLLVSPFWLGIGVAPDGRILVADENWIKVFDPYGNPIRRFGGTGDGPGEFRRARDLFISPDGYITVFGGQIGYSAHFFRPDYSFIERMDYRQAPPYQYLLQANELRPDRPEAVFCLNESDRLYIAPAIDLDRERRNHREVFLIHERDGSVEALAHNQQTDGIDGPNGPVVYMPALGVQLVVPLPRNRAAYIHGYHDSRTHEAGSEYTLTIIDLQSYERTTISHAYVPQLLQWESPEYDDDYKQQYPEQWQRMQEQFEIAARGIEERRYAVPVVRLEADGPYVFAFTTTSNDSSEALVDVFDTDASCYVCSAWFPSVYQGSVRNGTYCVFNEFRMVEDFPRVLKYRIDPRVYGRR